MISILKSTVSEAKCRSVQEYSLMVRWVVGSFHHGGTIDYLRSRQCSTIFQTKTEVILQHHADTIGANVWTDTGVSSKNTRLLINISQLATTLTPLVCRALPAFHAFTGCDFTASFMRKAKARPYQLMVKNEQFLSTFALLGASENVDSKVSATIEEYVCCMYGLKNLADVNEACLHLFRTSYAPKRPENPMDKIASADPCCLPPCKPVLVQILKRTNYVAKSGETQTLQNLHRVHRMRMDGTSLSVKTVSNLCGLTAPKAQTILIWGR